MRILSLLILLLLIPSAYSQPSSKVAAGLEDRVIVTPRKVIIVRSGKLANQSSEKKRATVIYPLISGLRDQQVLHRVQSILQVKHVFDYSLAEYREDTWLDEFGYKVNYNKNSILDITFTQSGSGAYPDTHTKHFAISLKDGSVIKARDVFVNTKLDSLATLVNRKLQAELAQILKENSDPEDTKTVQESQEALEFKLADLDEFSVGAKGITFLYDAGYPHVIQAFEPNGEYLFSFSELKPYIKRDGLLGQFIH